MAKNIAQRMKEASTSYVGGKSRSRESGGKSRMPCEWRIDAPAGEKSALVVLDGLAVVLLLQGAGVCRSGLKQSGDVAEVVVEDVVVDTAVTAVVGLNVEIDRKATAVFVDMGAGVGQSITYMIESLVPDAVSDGNSKEKPLSAFEINGMVIVVVDAVIEAVENGFEIAVMLPIALGALYVDEA